MHMGKPLLIITSGLPGSGKSTVAEGVAKKLKLPIFSVDPIESSIIKAGIGKSFKTGLAAYLVAETLADEQLKLGNSVIIDAVNAEEEGRDVWRGLAKKHGLSLIIIDVFVSDQALHKKRLEARVRNLHGFSEITWERVLERQKAFTLWKEPAVRPDSSDDLQANIEKAIGYIRAKQS